MGEDAPKQPQHDEMPEGIYATYRDERQHLTQAEQDYGKTYDRYVITLSGGAIALSLAFLDAFIGENAIVEAWRLIVAWICLGLAIGMSVFGIYLTPISFAEHRGILDNEAAKGGKQYWTRVRSEQHEKQKSKMIRSLNLLSLLAFLVGLAMLLWFAFGSVSAKGIANE